MSMTAKELFGTNLRARRKACGFSQEELAEKANVSAKHIGALESGKSFVSADLLDKFSALLHTPIADFFRIPLKPYMLNQKKSSGDDIRSKIAILEEEHRKHPSPKQIARMQRFIEKITEITTEINQGIESEE